MTRSGAGSGGKANTDQPDAGDQQLGLFDTATASIKAGQSAKHTPPPTPTDRPPPKHTDKTRSDKARASKPADDKAGHRQRLVDRFRDSGDSMPDYELLEMILFRVFPRGDTKPTAKALMAKFKSFAEVMNASAERLMEVPGIGQRAVDEIKLVRASALRLLKKQVMHKEVLGTWSAVLEYCRAAQAHDEIERFRILFLDKRNQLIADEVQQSGTVDHTPVYVREIIKRTLQLGATAIVLVHNHPSGDPMPSRADIDMTMQIIKAASPLNITVHDHIIVGRKGHFSFKGQKLI